ncbi:MAG: MFS transporter [Nocardioides sp.]|jgi:EmrB/QacA subfamily drug resistance transporter
MTSASTIEPETESPARHPGWALVLICMAQMMVVLDGTIANIALPYIGADLDISQANLSWIVTGYALTFGGFLLLGGRLADLFGRRRIFMVGVLVFAAASLIGGTAQTEFVLLAARALQGTGAAMASPAALALITTTFAPGPARNRAFGVYAAMAGIGAAVGLLLGGWLTGMDHPFGIAGWRYTFLFVVPVGLLAAFFAPRVLPESDRHDGELDVPGAVTATAGLLAIVFGLTRAGEEAHGWTDTWTIVSLLAGAALIGVFMLIETRVEHPLLPFRVFNSKSRRVAFVVMMIVPGAMFAMFFFLSLFTQLVMGYSPLKTGVSFLPFSVGMILSATTASKLIAKVDPRFLSGIGTLLAATALFGFSRLSVPDDASGILSTVAGGGHLGQDVNYWTHVMPFILLMAFGMGLNFVPLTLTALHNLRAEDSGIGSGVLNTMQQVGGALGLATLSTVALHFASQRTAEIAPTLVAAAEKGHLPLTPDQLGGLAGLTGFAHGATTAFLVGSCMLLLASSIVWLFLDVKHEDLAQDAQEHPDAALHMG